MFNRATLTKTALTDQVVDLLEERILDRAYRPGERLNVDRLCREFSVSSSPVREALVRLVGTGLVVSVSFAGFSVAPVPDRSWFEQVRDYRIIAEGWAVRSVARRRTPTALCRMKASLEAMDGGILGTRARDYMPISEADASFHEAMLEACGNDILAQSVRQLRPHLHHSRLFSQVPQDIGLLLDEHRAILQAVEAGDEDAAYAALEAHLMASWQRYDAWPADDGKGG